MTAYLTLKIGTYNIRNADGGEHIDGIAREIKTAGLDILGLQELDYHAERSKSADILSELSVISGMKHHIFKHSIPFQGGFYGNGILSAHKIVSCERVFLPSGFAEQRALLHCIIAAGSRKINFFNTHLSLEENLRPAQFTLLNELISKHRPFILTGDFNIASFDEFNALHRVVTANTENNPIYTYRDEECTDARDNIIVSDDLHIGGVTLSQTEYSDHNMLICEVKLCQNH
jgi:endonuclease/exonuclease/phosphatase family metal-dependent hydrolase